jgi:hypothetical protein
MKPNPLRTRGNSYTAAPLHALCAQYPPAEVQATFHALLLSMVRTVNLEKTPPAMRGVMAVAVTEAGLALSLSDAQWEAGVKR